MNDLGYRQYLHPGRAPGAEKRPETLSTPVPTELALAPAPAPDPPLRLAAVVITPEDPTTEPYRVEAFGNRKCLEHKTLFYGPGAKHRAMAFAAVTYWPVTVMP